MVNFRVNLIVDPAAAVSGTTKIEDRLERLERKGDQVNNTFRRFVRTLGVGFSVRALIEQVDTYSALQNRLKVVTTSTEELAQANANLLGIANRSRSSISAVVQIYSRLAVSTKQLGVNEKELISFTETLAKTIALSGASSYEAQGALIQFSQAMAAGKLRGDELRSVLEQLPEVANIIGKRFGVTGQQLSKLGEAGLITGQQIIAAFQDSREEIEQRFARTAPTIGQAFVVLKNQILTTIGQIDQANGISKGFAEAIIAIANNIDIIVKALGNLAIFLGPSYVFGALSKLFVLVKANPFGLILTAISLLISLVPQFQAQFEAVIQAIGRATAAFFGFNTEVQSIGQILTDVFQSSLLTIASFVDSSVAYFNGLAAALGAIFDAIPSKSKAVGELITFYLAKGFENFTIAALASLQALGDVIVDFFKGIYAALDQTFQAGRATLAGELAEAEAAATNARLEFEGAGKAVLNIGSYFDRSFKKISNTFDSGGLAQNVSDEAANLGSIVASEFARGIDESKPNAQSAVGRLLFGEPLIPEPGFIGPQLPQPDRPQQGLPAAEVKLKGYDEEIQKLRNIIAIEQQRILFGDQSAAQLEARLNLEAQGVKLSEDQVAELSKLVQLQQDTTAVSNLTQQFDVNRNLLEQERQLNLLLAERPDLASSIEQAMLSAKIAALETSTALEDGFERAFLKLKQEATDLAAVGEAVVNVFADRASEALTTFLTTGEFNFKKFASSVLDEITKILVRLLIVQAISAFLPGGSGAIGAAAGGFGSGLVGGGGGGRARGGTVQPDRSYIVGENGPEIFQPRTTGTVIPNQQPAAPAPVNVQVVNVDDPNAVPAAITRGGSDEAIVNVLARNRDRVKQLLG